MTYVEALKKNKIQLIIILGLLAVVYHQIISEMVKDWYNDENYSHGFLVPIIAAYFFCQRWPELRGKAVAPSNKGFVIILIGLIQLIVSWLGTEYFLMRSSLIVIVIGIVLVLFGPHILKGMSLPLSYLIFMVPIPYIIYDMVAFPLKLFVTKVSVLILKMVGVVVIRDGNIIMFPALTLEVADACSGIRSLVSLLALAVAYAFFTQTSNLRRCIIIVSAVPIAIITNAMRVIGTGLLAQWWGEKAAQGFFHEFAGLAVFALALALLISVGTMIKGKNMVQPSSIKSEVFCTSTPVEGKIYQARVVAIGILLISAALYINFHRNSTVPVNRSFNQFPLKVNSWEMTSETLFSDPVLKVLGATDYISRQYRGADGKKIVLYIGYHDGAKSSGVIHSPKNCLPGSGWYKISSGLLPVTLNGKAEQIVRAVYQKGESKELFLYWFQMKGKVLNNEYALKLGEISNSILYGRKEETFIRISIPCTDSVEQSTAKGELFIKDFYPVILGFLPQ